MLKAIILRSEERSEISLAYASNDIYRYISVIADNISSKSQQFYLLKEELFHEVLMVVDTIRKYEGTDEAANYALSAFNKLFNNYRSLIDEPQANILDDLRLNTAAVTYTAASLLTLSSAPDTVQYIPALIGSIEGNPANVPYLMKLSQSSIKRNLSDEAINAWTAYYMSDRFISDEMNEILLRIREFNYIDMEGLNRLGLYSYEKFMDMFRDALKAEANILLPFLKRYKDMGIFNFHNDDPRIVFAKLRARFPEMRQYDYPNFEKYAREVQLFPPKRKKKSGC